MNKDQTSRHGARARAAKVLARVVTGRQQPDHVLERHSDPDDDPRDQAFTREICYGVLRWYHRLDFLLQGLMEKPLKARDSDIRMLLLAGLYQLDFLRTPDHAAVAGTVDAARELGKGWAMPLLNAVLRRYQRERETITSRLDESEQALYSHPDWFIEALRRQWPDHWQTVLEGNNRRPPLHLRVNLSRISRAGYIETLQRENIEAAPITISDTGVHILTPMPVNELPGFDTGLVSVQDGGAQLAARLLDLRAQQRVLDACAAPGGKTGHIAELSPHPAELIAVDNDAERLEKLQETQRRLGFNAKVLHSDIIQREDWWDGKFFDRILLDVPCSATGVIRRHPDIKLLRAPDQIDNLKETQQRMLEAVWPVLGKGGKLLYVTCSVFREEGEERLRGFMRAHPDAEAEIITADWGLSCEPGKQLLPGLDDTDGFYYARLLKTG